MAQLCTLSITWQQQELKARMKRVEVNFCPLNSRTQKIHHTHKAHKRLQSMMKKEPQISRHSELQTKVLPSNDVSCENNKYGGRERATKKIQISIVLISNNKTIPFNYYLLARYAVNGMVRNNKEAFMMFPVLEIESWNLWGNRL